MYEFVPKSELMPVKTEIDEIIRKLQNLLREEKITFEPKLVGSGGKHLVTRLVGGNEGFDFDYNLVLKKCPEKLSPKDIKLIFIRKLNFLLETSDFSYVEDNRQVMTIKFIDVQNKRIVHSCDFAIVNEYEENSENYQEIIIFDRYYQNYLWNSRPYAKDHEIKLSNIINNGLWFELKGEYLKLKNSNNDPEKKSFQLYFEAINNVYNHYEWN